ncbi:MAG: Hint domain-containing protein, partial [Gluconacetobacter diazotrophicus]|nr:Hint domain-containing protein [Gluconacetobacter diazotrophicus]
VLFDGTLYVSRDTKQGPTANISSYGGEPTAATTPTVLAGLSNRITLTAAEANTVNAGSVGKSVFLSPENFFFADPNTLYVADGGNPKGGGIGDGGLQKWSLASGTWTLDYTLSAGLNLVKNSAASGTTGLIGLAGQVSGGTVTLYATNATVGDLDPTYLFGITDQLSATAAAPAGENFTTLVTAAADTNIRGVSFAPQLACFVRGTRLLTAAGAVPVEDLELGAPMLVERDGRRVVEPATWIGRRRIDLRAHPEPALVRPVRLLPGALGDGIPSATLRLSPDHAVRQDGSLVPVRFLLNGASIAAEFPDAVEYFHVELPSHGILLAEDAPVESFLDTGNRAQFGTEPVFPLHPVFAPGPLPARTVLPVETDPAALEALWHACAARSDRLGHPVAAAATTRDPALRLRLPDGTELHPVPASGTDPAHPDRFRFRLPAALGPDGAAVILLSRAAAPAAARPWLDDRRSLGIAVRGLVAWSGSRALPLAPGGGAGWWAPEAAPASTPGSAAASWCWTDGAAVIALPSGTDRLELDLFAVADYPPAVPDHREPRRAA